MQFKWIRRRWLDFRQGHGIYLIFLLTFFNFVLIFHRLLIERIEILDEIFPNLWMFASVFIIIYIPIAVLVGRWHRRSQVKIETEQIFRNNPFMARNFRMIVDILQGDASKEQIERFRNFLKRIEEGKGSSS